MVLGRVISVGMVLLLSTVVKCRNSVHVYQFFDRVTKDGVRYLANKKHSILMLILIAEFVAEVLTLQDKRLKSSCENFVSISVNEYNVDYVPVTF